MTQACEFQTESGLDCKNLGVKYVKSSLSTSRGAVQAICSGCAQDLAEWRDMTNRPIPAWEVVTAEDYLVFKVMAS